MDKGVLYICYDSQRQEVKIPYIEELKRSIFSLRDSGCNLPITVYTDGLVKEEDVQGLNNVSVVTKEYISSTYPNESRVDIHNRGFTISKLYCFRDLPYDVTIFADTDTQFLDDPSCLISEDVDLAICREVFYINSWTLQGDVPLPRSEKIKIITSQLTRRFNSGFFVARKTEPFNALIDKAIEIAEEEGIKQDQLPINLAFCYIGDITVKVLSQQWNTRGQFGKSIKNPKMIHQRE